MGNMFTFELSEEKQKNNCFVPRGFAHGFVVLSETTIFSYKCDNFYNKESERGIIYNDETLNIDWQLPKDQLIISEKDLLLPKFKNHRIMMNTRVLVTGTNGQLGQTIKELFSKNEDTIEFVFCRKENT